MPVGLSTKVKSFFFSRSVRDGQHQQRGSHLQPSPQLEGNQRNPRRARRFTAVADAVIAYLPPKSPLDPMSARLYPISATGLTRASSSDSLSDSNAIPEQILAYYQSEDAGRFYASPDDLSKPPVYTRSLSSPRSSSPCSFYSSDSDSKYPDDTEPELSPSPSDTLRAQHPLDTAPQRLRINTRQMHQPRQTVSESGHGTTFMRSNSLRSRRGHSTRVDPLALVRPLDVLPETSPYLTPPTSAPASGPRDHLFPAEDTRTDPAWRHQRSVSDAIGSSNKKDATLLTRKTSRDVGIVGTTYHGRTPSENTPVQLSTVSSARDLQALKPPIFQMPRSRSSSPFSTTSDASDRRYQPERFPIDATSPTQTPLHKPVTGALASKTGRQGHDHMVTRTHPTAEQGTDAAPIVPVPVAGLASPLSFHALSLKPMSTNASTPAFSPSDPSTYVHYLPGVHATAGPLPPPPRAAITITSPPPPRPPRLVSRPQSRLSTDSRSASPGSTSAGLPSDLEAVKQALKLPQSVEAALSGWTSTTMKLNSPLPQLPGSEERIIGQNPVSQGNSSSVVHVREGAFPPSKMLPLRPSVDKVLELAERQVAVKEERSGAGLGRSSSMTVKLVSRRNPELRLRGPNREDTWTAIQSEDTSSDEEISRSTGHLNLSLPISLPSTDAPQSGTNPGRSPSRLKTALLKRFSSLPRTPSSPASSTASRIEHSPKPAMEKVLPLPSSSRPPSPLPEVTPSSLLPPPVVTKRESPPLPSLPPLLPYPLHRKIRCKDPAALWCSEIYSMHSPQERSMLYAQKINELYTLDCGLSEWISETTYKALNRTKKKGSAYLGPVSTPTSLDLSLSRRRVSPGSIMTVSTFPTRPDAYHATDLGPRPKSDDADDSDDVPLMAPPPLPYPSLALAVHQAPRAAWPNAASPASTSPTQSKPSSGGGFFSVLARKGSLKRRSNMISAATNQQQSTQKSPAPSRNAPLPQPRPVEISTTPSVPGGPRAAPHRARRSQTFTAPLSPAAPLSSASTSGNTSSAMTRRPSLAPSPSPSSHTETHESDFDRSLTKLHDLLPYEDREVLKGYLRRAGHDMLAIGQYLDDEKNGVIKRK